MLVVVELLGVGGGTRGPGVQVDHDVVVLAGAPQRLVVRVGVAGQAGAQGHGRQHDAPVDAVVPGPGDLLDGPVHVVEVDGDAPGPPPGRGGAELGQPPVVGVQGRPHHLEVLGRVTAQVHGRRQSPGQHRPGEDHLGVDALLLEVGQPPAPGVRREDPLLAVEGQPLGRGLGVDAHPGQPPGGHRPHGVGVGDLAGVDAPEHGDGHGREVPEGRHRLAVGRVDVGEEFVQRVRRGVGVGRHHHVGPPRERVLLVVCCHRTHLPRGTRPHPLRPQTTAGHPPAPKSALR